jgi:hypothetical protein
MKMDNWKTAAVIVAASHYVRFVKSKRNPTNVEKVVTSLVLEIIDREMYDNSKAMLERVTDSILYDDWPEARELREYLELEPVN